MKALFFVCIVALALCQTINACDSNQHHVNCGTSCPLTCANYKNPPKFCTYDCFIGCACNDGYVKKTDKHGACVKPSEC
ncbi:hypothetical protein CDAR_451881 [Caerostris darwini]|uniref:TIL domain-containing protein n=1 Tax=Caerostris darwini TaxID=1538125 RepID=A0AAV4X7K3_9ARAC|nr:hypothetical protein CDAR_451881 [Caerostris darwini]